MNTHNIRRAAKEDLDLVAPLFDAYRQFYGRQPEPTESRAFLAERLERADSVIFIAASDRTALGFCQLYPSFSSVSVAKIMILNDLYVAPEGRKRGIGSGLLGAAVDYARKIGAIRLTLTTGVENTTAQKVYRGNGWQEDHEFLTFHFPTKT